jgi:aspartyl-tRNA(Asn)/glutamyl-tRNA(Gln) amidotransferase subunit C
MKISKEEVLYVAHLARLDLDAESIEKFAVDTAGIKPTSHAIFLTNAFREDKQREHLDRDRALANAPESEEGHFVVPKIVG